MSDIKFRKARSSDIVFIIRSWCDSFKTAHGAGILSIDEWSIPCQCGKDIRYDYSFVMEATLARLLQRSGVSAWVAYDPDGKAPYDLYGYLISENDANVPSYQWQGQDDFKLVVEKSQYPLVHYVFVKKAYRKNGIAAGLFTVAGIDPGAPYLYTCKTPTVSKLEQAGKMPHSRWFPLSARFSK